MDRQRENGLEMCALNGGTMDIYEWDVGSGSEVGRRRSCKWISGWDRLDEKRVGERRS